MGGSRCGRPWPGTARAVLQPKLLSGRNRITQASDLLQLPLLRLDGWTTWSKWFEAAGASASARRGPVLNQASMLIDAAVDGQGVALARTTLAAWDLLHGRLVVPIDVALPLENTYWIVYPKLASGEPSVATLRDWLLTEAADDERRLRAVIGKGYAGSGRLFRRVQQCRSQGRADGNRRRSVASLSSKDWRTAAARCGS
jgi:LysR family glycine cleavage system transcriptional activator